MSVTVSRPVIAGNWKMNHGPAATAAFFRALGAASVPAGRTLIVFPPALSLPAARALIGGGRIQLGVQNTHWEESGAFTGELSASMAAEAGAAFALVGHSERRHLFGETDEQTARKVVAAARARLVPVLCVGETLAERRAGRVEEVILRQLDAATGGLAADSVERLLLAYEPVWAIGTGETATAQDASAAHAALRRRLRERLGESAGSVPILYGGSVKPQNAGELLAAADVDGVLVGGASLDPASFMAIARA